MMHAAIAAAKDADVVVLVLGDDLAENGETKDRSDLALYGRQNELARRVFAVCPNVITVMVTGKPLVLGEVKKCSAALLQCFNGGDLGGKAVAALLLGDENFSGKLPISFPYSTGTLPCYYNQYDYWHDGRYMDAPSTNWSMTRPSPRSKSRRRCQRHGQRWTDSRTHSWTGERTASPNTSSTAMTGR